MEFFITDFQVLMDFTEITGTDQSTSTGNTPSKTKERGSCLLSSYKMEKNIRRGNWMLRVNNSGSKKDEQGVTSWVILWIHTEIKRIWIPTISIISDPTKDATLESGPSIRLTISDKYDRGNIRELLKLEIFNANKGFIEFWIRIPNVAKWKKYKERKLDVAS
jgi:hypothetical protein